MRIEFLTPQQIENDYRFNFAISYNKALATLEFRVDGVVIRSSVSDTMPGMRCALSHANHAER
jgi:hypothetical protein